MIFCIFFIVNFTVVSGSEVSSINNIDDNSSEVDINFNQQYSNNENPCNIDDNNEVKCIKDDFKCDENNILNVNDDSYQTNLLNANGKKSFRDLNNLINNQYSKIIYLNDDYCFNSEIDAVLIDGIFINRNNLVIDGNNHVLDANGKSRIFFINTNVNNVCLKNIIFKNGFTSNDRVSDYNPGYGSAILWRAATGGEIINCTFENNNAFRGAVRFHTVTNAKVINCTFRNNTAWQGCGIFYDAPNSLIYGCKFIDNYADWEGAAIYQGTGANNAMIEKCIFINNNVVNYGGAICTVSRYGSSIKDSVFINNSAIKYGGAILIDCDYKASEGTIINYGVYNSTFINNTAKYGGGVHVYSCNTKIVNSNFIGNNASIRGGAIEIYGYDVNPNEGNTNIIGCNFVDNYVPNGWGGAIDSLCKDTTILDSNFINNTAGNSLGGAIYFSNSGVVKGCVFTNNSAKTAVIYHSSNSFVRINNNIFFKNNCGSVIYFKSSGNINMDYNWYGNIANGYKNRPQSTVNNWLFLNATVMPNSHSVMGHSDISFKLYVYNSTSKKVLDYDNNLLSHIDLSVSSINGCVDKNIVNFADTIRYTGTVVGIDYVTAMADNVDIFTLELNVIKLDSNLSVEFQEVHYGNNSINLSYINLATGKVNITLKGLKNNYSYKNIDLNTSILLTNVKPDYYEVTVDYSGDEVFLNASVSGNYTVLNPITITPNNIVHIDEFVNISIVDLKEDIVNVFINGNKIPCDIVDGKFFIRLGYLPVGYYNVTVEYNYYDALFDYIYVQNWNFTELQSLIDNVTGDTLSLNHDYVCEVGEKVINITEPISVNGNGHILNANNIGGVFDITADGVGLYNITIVNADNCNAINIKTNNIQLDNVNFTNNTGKCIVVEGNGSVIGDIAAFNHYGDVIVVEGNENKVINVSAFGGIGTVVDVINGNCNIINNVSALNYKGIVVKNSGNNSNMTNIDFCNCFIEVFNLFKVNDTVIFCMDLRENSNDMVVLIDGKVYELEDNKVVIDTSDFIEGNYIITASVFENHTYAMATTSLEFSIMKHNAMVDIVGVENTTYIAGCDFNITVNTNSTGAVKVSINDKVYDLDDYNNVIFDSTMLVEGHYTVTATVFENNRYTGATKILDFTIIKNKAVIDIVGVENTTYIAGCDFNITVNTNSTGAVKVSINDKVYDLDDYNNVIFDSTMLVEGHYTVTATVFENNRYTGATKILDFTIIKNKAVIDIVGVENTTYIAGTDFNITVNTNSTGVVKVSINDKVYDLDELNNVIFDSTVLVEGHYIVNATVFENNRYTGATKILDFSIMKHNVVVDISGVENTTYIAGVDFNITVNTNSTGVVKVSINDKVYNLDDYNNVIFDSTEFVEGHYTVTVTVFENYKYTGATKILDFTIIKNKTVIDIVGVENTTYIAGTDFNITVNTNSTGVVKVSINDKAYDLDDYNNVIFDSTMLVEGHYTVTATVYENNKYTNATKILEFTIIKNKAIIDIVGVENTTYIAGSDFNITVNTNSTGIVKVSVNDKVYDLDDYNNVIFDSTMLVEGHYTVTATVYENKEYSGATKILDFTIIKNKAIIDIVGVENTTYIAGVDFNITVNTNSTGVVKVSINDKVYNLDDYNNVIFDSTEFVEGHYTVTVTVFENYKYTGATKILDFTIIKNKTVIDIVGVENTTYIAGTDFNITVNTNSTGVVKVSINDKAYDLDDYNNVIFDSTMLVEGHYTVTATVYENKEYSGATKILDFTIIKNKAIIDVVGVENTTYIAGSDFNITVNTNSTGVVKVSVNGKVYDLDELNNVIFDSTVLVEGHYTVNATVFENYKYTGASAILDFTIIKNNAVVDIVGVENTTYIAGSDFNITVNTNSTGVVKVSVNGKVYDLDDYHNLIFDSAGLVEGHYIVNATVFENYKFTGATTSLVFTIMKKNVFIRIIGVKSVKKVYKKTELKKVVFYLKNSENKVLKNIKFKISIKVNKKLKGKIGKKLKKGHVFTVKTNKNGRVMIKLTSKQVKGFKKGTYKFTITYKSDSLHKNVVKRNFKIKIK